MAAYADYTFYTTTYLGNAISQADFPRLALRASEAIDRMTFNRAADETDEDVVALIKMATCAVAEAQQSNEAEGGADGVVSESVGSHSVTYSEASSRRQTAFQKLENAARAYLESTGLMFRGFADGEYGSVGAE